MMLVPWEEHRHHSAPKKMRYHHTQETPSRQSNQRDCCRKCISANDLKKTYTQENEQKH